MKSISTQFESNGRVSIEDYFRKLEHRVFAIFFALLIVGNLTYRKIENLIGTNLLSQAIDYLKMNWPRFAAESAILESTGSKYLAPYYFANTVFPIVAALLIVSGYLLVRRNVVVTGSEKFVWTLRGIPYVAIVLTLVGMLMFYVRINIGDSPVSSALFQTDLFYVWLPVLYTAITSLVLRFALLIGIHVFSLGR